MDHRHFLNYLFGRHHDHDQGREADGMDDDNDNNIPELRNVDADVDMAPPPTAPRVLRARVDEIPDEEADDDVAISAASSVYATPSSSVTHIPISASSTPSTPTTQPERPQMPVRSSTRRARVEDDHDDERDRRHPSERVGSGAASTAGGSGSAYDSLRSAVEQNLAETREGGDSNNNNSQDGSLSIESGFADSSVITPQPQFARNESQPGQPQPGVPTNFNDGVMFIFPRALTFTVPLFVPRPIVLGSTVPVPLISQPIANSTQSATNSNSTQPTSNSTQPAQSAPQPAANTMPTPTQQPAQTVTQQSSDDAASTTGTNTTPRNPYRFFQHGIRTPVTGVGMPLPPLHVPQQAPPQPQAAQPQQAPAGGNAPQALQQGGGPTPEEQLQAHIAEAAGRLVQGLFGGMAVFLEGPIPPVPNPAAAAAPNPAPAAPQEQGVEAPTQPQPQQPQDGEQPQPQAQPQEGGTATQNAQRPLTFLPQLLARLASASAAGVGAPGAGGGRGIPIPFLFPFPFAVEREVDDPERAKALIRGLESVPEGLVRRLVRVGEMTENEEGGCGDGGCAVCWEGLLDDEEEASESSEHKHGDGEERTEDKEEGEPKEKKKEEEPLPKIVSLPCAHVFHSRCLIPWFSKPRQTTCPTCRFNVDPEGLMRRAPEARAAPAPFGAVPEPAANEEGDAPVPQPANENTNPNANANPQGQAPPQTLPFAFPRDFISIGLDVVFTDVPPPGFGAGAGRGLNMVFSLGPDGTVIPVHPPAAHRQEQQGQPGEEQQGDNLAREREERDEEMENGDNENENDEREEDFAELQRFLDALRGGRERRGDAAQVTPAAPAAAPAPAPATPAPATAAPAAPATPPTPTAAPGTTQTTPRRPRVGILNGGFSIPFGGPGLGPGGPGMHVTTGAGRTMSEAFGALLGNLGPMGPQAQPAQAPQQQEQQQPQQQQDRERQEHSQPQPQQESAPAENANPATNANPEAAPRPRNPRNILSTTALFDIPLAPFGAPRPQRPPQSKKAWTLPPAPGPTLRQRIERKEREAGLRCSETSCGVGPSDDDPFVAVAEQGMKQLSIHDRGDEGKPVCGHRFHSSCLVSAERVAMRGVEEHVVGKDVEVVCPVCKGEGWVSKNDWDEGVKALL